MAPGPKKLEKVMRSQAVLISWHPVDSSLSCGDRTKHSMSPGGHGGHVDEKHWVQVGVQVHSTWILTCEHHVHKAVAEPLSSFL